MTVIDWRNKSAWFKYIEQIGPNTYIMSVRGLVLDLLILVRDVEDISWLLTCLVPSRSRVLSEDRGGIHIWYLHFPALGVF